MPSLATSTTPAKGTSTGSIAEADDRGALVAVQVPSPGQDALGRRQALEVPEVQRRRRSAGGEQAAVQVQDRAGVGAQRFGRAGPGRRAGRAATGRRPSRAGRPRPTGPAPGTRPDRRGRPRGPPGGVGVLQRELLAGVQAPACPALGEEGHDRGAGPGLRSRRSGCGAGGCRGWTAPTSARPSRVEGSATTSVEPVRPAVSVPRRGWRRS